MVKKVLIASENPVKIAATKAGFEKMFPKETFEFIGKGVQSGVSDQPRGLDETLNGAENRIIKLKKKEEKADFYVGIEGGIVDGKNGVYAFAWIVVDSSTNKRGSAQTGHFLLPPKVVTLINQGYELGHADDIVFGTKNSKQKLGSVGILTNNVIDRKAYYEHATILALVSFM